MIQVEPLFPCSPVREIRTHKHLKNSLMPHTWSLPMNEFMHNHPNAQAFGKREEIQGKVHYTIVGHTSPSLVGRVELHSEITDLHFLCPLIDRRKDLFLPLPALLRWQFIKPWELGDSNWPRFFNDLHAAQRRRLTIRTN